MTDKHIIRSISTYFILYIRSISISMLSQPFFTENKSPNKTKENKTSERLVQSYNLSLVHTVVYVSTTITRSMKDLSAIN